MSKHKIDINKNSLSWEKTLFRKCDKKDCDNEGQFKAPKSRNRLNEYYFFCLNHIKEYNKSWDFYKGLSVDEIETSMREDTIWNRPSWPLKGNYNKVMDQINDFFKEGVNNLESNESDKTFFRNRLVDENLTKDENKALSMFNLELPITLDKIKKTYKKLVKIFHPDVNGNDKNAEEKFKEINSSYKILLEKFKNDK